MSDNDINESILWRVVEDEALIINLETGNYYSLNPIATSILIALSQGNSPSNIATQLSLKFNIPFDSLWTDIEAFMNQLQTEALINIQALEGFSLNLPEDAVYEQPLVRKYDQIDCIAAYSPD